MAGDGGIVGGRGVGWLDGVDGVAGGRIAAGGHTERIGWGDAHYCVWR